MLASAPFALLLTVLSSAPAVPGALPHCEALHQRLELEAEPVGPPPEVCLTSGRVTTFVFPEPLPPGAVELEGKGQGLQQVHAGRFVTLLAGADMVAGERRKLTVRFGDGAAPASGVFFLVVHPSRAPYQVEVLRRERTVHSYQQELQAKRTELQQCLVRAAVHPPATLEGQLDGFRGQLRSGTMGGGGVAAERLARGLTLGPQSALKHGDVWSYRSVARVALEVKLELHTEGPPWEAVGATLVDAQGHEVALLPLWQSAPITKDTRGRVAVEAEVGPEQAQGVFTLTLWEAGGKRTFTLSGVRFPALPAHEP
ncbi:MAG TPA: DUF2381 family protein [Myxococcaceae bacterium]|nr:DUF2381 family protein [Myxococcaceae bacterium]